MKRRSHSARSLLVLAGAFLTLTLLGSCSVPVEQGGPALSAPPSMPAARMGLPPATRMFHDELEPYGDWVLIEPYGYVFRPDVNTVAWRPYEHGWWEPSDVFGWIWNSDEPFGWLTYHYGTWLFDDFQGWVWTPGVQWGPAWVAWVSVGDWIGWAPLSPIEFDRYNDIPGGVFVYASAAQFGREDESMRATFVTGLTRTRDPLQSIVRLGRADGVTFNKGPDPALVKRLGGVEMSREPFRPRRLELPISGDDDGTTLLLRTRRLYAQAEREWNGWRNDGATPKPAPGGPPRPPVWRETPAKKPAAAPLGGPSRTDSLSERPAKVDSTRIRPAQRDTTDGKVRSPRPPAPRKPGAKPLGDAPADTTH